MTDLVTLHGFMGAPSSWDESLARLRAAPHVVGLRCLGHGVSSQATTFEHEVARLLEQLPPAGRPCVLAGYSLGARLALGMLASAPERFVGALLIGAHPGLRKQVERDERRQIETERAHELLAAGLPAFVEHWQALPLFASQRTVSDATLATQRSVRLGHDAPSLARSLRVLGLADMPSRWEMLARLRVPARWMVGADDTRFVELAREVAKVAPRVQVECVAGAGHNLLLERPVQVAAALDELLRCDASQAHEAARSRA